MELADFKIVKNRQRPNWCYAYEKYSDDMEKKFSIFTMNGGKTFLVSITSYNLLGKLVDTDYEETFDNVDDALKGILNFLNNNKG